jgi:hypothetical protein
MLAMENGNIVPFPKKLESTDSRQDFARLP